MENILDENQERNNLTDRDIFTEIWTSPRQVFKYINDNHYDKYVTILLLLSGISKAFDRASMKNMGDKLPLLAIVPICIIAGGLFGWISYYIYAALISWTGKWLDARGNTQSILRMLAFAMLPSIIALIFLIPQLIIYGDEIFKSEGDITSAGWFSNVFVYGSMILEGVLAVVTVTFCVIGTSEVQKLSIGKSILNLLLPIIVILVPILLIVLVITGIS